MRKKQLLGLASAMLIAGGSFATLSLTSCGKNGNTSAVETVSPEAVVTEKPEEMASPEAEATATVTPGEEATQAPEATASPEAEATETPSAEQEATATPAVTETPVATEEAMTDYSAMSDSELITEVSNQLKSIKISKMTKIERNIYSVSVFRDQIGGGIYGYLKSSENETVQYIVDALNTMGLTDSSVLLDDFLDMSRLDLTSTKKLSAITSNEFSYDIFDEEYAEIKGSEDITKALAAYIRSNLASLNLK